MARDLECRVVAPVESRGRALARVSPARIRLQSVGAAPACLPSRLPPRSASPCRGSVVAFAPRRFRSARPARSTDSPSRRACLAAIRRPLHGVCPLLLGQWLPVSGKRSRELRQVEAWALYRFTGLGMRKIARQAGAPRLHYFAGPMGSASSSMRTNGRSEDRAAGDWSGRRDV